MKIQEENMEFEETYIPGEIEIWAHIPTGKYYKVPIKITRYFEEARLDD